LGSNPAHIKGAAAAVAVAEQVRRGMAWGVRPLRQGSSLYPLQERARAAQLGLWADAAPVPPWEWRAAKGELEYRARK
jgi:endonuclease YncB( thermonuclease family)